ncbi:hypothetical protein KVH07_12980 [Streptomyces olivaceus]|uniref:HEPN domain-containing protein n=1 Tax=Streptomyces olivaceus TaxID=47716 RepID=A0ABS7W4R5_STROV|nr:hypothetical protein [Streptomyces olivaceus]MBZ6090612.1 hypothetical protein [Streptomyces olivaceus]MBZ6096788.1 hypothetical protein [Streptomyces olivaceus]MBZ6117562.1 hypothetical protein [Streptomyces olivaceus]MBZ6152972.1 hypothetical protein [Streptomyces olivaceus]MBZ6193840.1 hypothetical protein [Streptomyces olivaceus]
MAKGKWCKYVPMVLQVGAKALKRRRDELRGSADSVVAEGNGGDPATVALLLFYAAECGLKERLLIRRGLRDTAALAPTHDLRELAKELNLPRALLSKLRSCRLHASVGASVALAELHQAWRYGAKLDGTDEKEATEALRALIKWCEQD